MKKNWGLIMAFAFLIILAGRSSGAQRHAIRFDDFISIKRVSDPQLSPDGSIIAFVITVMEKTVNRGNSDIWIVPSSGGEIRRLTSSPQADFNPRWSPDGKKIAFISARNGAPQVFMIDLAGGEAQPLTSISPGAKGVIWSPTGTHLAFASSVYPDCPDDDCNKKKNEEREKSQVKAQIYDHLLFRHWNAWRDGTRSHLFVMPAEGGKAVDVTPGDYDAPPIALGGTEDYAFSPDGKEVCFVRNIDPEFKRGLGTNNDIFLTLSTGGEIRKITENPANDNQPVYSPDGRYIAYRAMARPGFEADKYRLILYDRRSQKSINLTESLDYSVGEVVWTSNSASICFTSEEKGRTALFRLNLADKKTEKVLDGYYLKSPVVSPDGKTLVFLKETVHHPADIFCFDLESTELRQVSDINRDLLAKLELPAAEEFWFEGAAKDKVHGFLLKPPSFDPAKKYPLVMLIHGGPQGAWSDNFHFRWNAEMFAAPGYVVAMINFHGSTGYGQAFTDSISGDWGGKPYKDIITGLGYLHGRYPFIDTARNAAAGASYGGYMIDWIEGQTDLFRCLISHAGVFDLSSMYGSTEELWFPEWEFKGTPWTNPEQYQKWSPSTYVKNFKTPCLVIHGARDFRIPLSQALQFFTSLERQNIPSRFLYFPDEDHFVQKPLNAELWWKTVLDWLETYLKKD
jgi:dipeptidyl aminopeptidase/acylaminoacyl peptidase